MVSIPVFLKISDPFFGHLFKKKHEASKEKEKILMYKNLKEWSISKLIFFCVPKLSLPTHIFNYVSVVYIMYEI